MTITHQIAGLLALVWAAQNGGPSVQGETTSTSHGCNVTSWSIPHSVARDASARTMVARDASIASHGRKAYVAGSDVSVFTHDAVRANPLTVWELSRKNIGRPVGNFFFAYPKALMDDAGRLHLLWAEPTTPPGVITGVQWPPEPLGSVWTAAYDASKGWTAPKRIYATSAAIAWSPSAAVVGQFGAGAGIGIAVPVLTMPLLKAVFLQLRDSEWQAAEIDSAGVAITTASRDGKHVVVGYTAGLRGRARDRNSVFIRRSDDGGATWRSAVLVSQSGNTPAYEPKIFIGGDNTVHLVWKQMLSDGSAVLRHQSSRDLGDTWSAPHDVRLTTNASNLTAAIDACGRIHVVYDHWADGETGHLDYVIWHDGWSSLEHLFPRWRATGATLHATPDGRLLLVFMAQQVSESPMTPFTTVYSTARTASER
jgi:hypothetical protein